jgi:hypothetical protein
LTVGWPIGRIDYEKSSVNFEREGKMKKTIFCLIICYLYLAGCALNRTDCPNNLRQTLDQRTEELKSKKGICIAGRVKMSDGAHISSGEDVKVNFLQGADIPLWVYDGGWFVMDRTFQTGPYPRPAKLMLRAFGYDPIDASVAVLQGEITYLEFEMHKTPDEDLSSVTGIVMNDQNEPFEGAVVHFSFPYASHGMNSEPYGSIITGADGKYSFEGLPAAAQSVVATAPGYAYHSVHFTPAAGKTTTKDLKLYKNRGIIIDYVYQADGSRSFAGGDIKTGTIEWVNGNDGVDFSDGRVKEYNYKAPRDIEMRQDQDTLKFQVFYVSSENENGFYDAGVIDFESLTEAAESGYSTMGKPCVIGHTYVVRTYEGNYAKFVVRSISGRE